MNYPRVTEEDLTNNIKDIEYVTHLTHGGQIMRWCVITTQSGFAVTGDPSASVSPENDDAVLGMQIALNNARNKLWAFMGYELKSKVKLAQDSIFPTQLNIKDSHYITDLGIYVGTKAVRAAPLNLGHYNHHRGWEIPKDEDPDRLGYILQYPDGYISWTPKEVFEASYLSMEAKQEGESVDVEQTDETRTEPQASEGSWLDRVRSERDELNERLEKLKTFLNSQPVTNLPRHQVVLLGRQKNIMEEYLRILDCRML